MVRAVGEEGAMVTVQVRFSDEARWRAMTLPVSVQAAQTLAQAAKQLGIADTVAARPAPGG